jgi:hypothetical protein
MKNGTVWIGHVGNLGLGIAPYRFSVRRTAAGQLFLIVACFQSPLVLTAWRKYFLELYVESLI